MNTDYLLKYLGEQYAIINPRIKSTLETRGDRKAYWIEGDQVQCVVKTLSSPLLVYSVLNDFRPNCFRFPQIIPTRNGEFTPRFRKNYIVNMEFITGKEIISPDLGFYRNYGRIAACLHRQPENGLARGRLLSECVEIARISITDVPIPKQQKSVLLDFLNRVKFSPIMSLGVTHGDLSYYNILKNEDGYAVVDVDDMSFGPVAYELGLILAFGFVLTEHDFIKLGMPCSNQLRFLSNEFVSFWDAYYRDCSLLLEDLRAVIDCALVACAECVYSEKDSEMIQANYERFCYIQEHRDEILKIMTL